jgi:hypothetical protein
VCTASWLRHEGALRLLFNRDELRTREPAMPPRLFETGGTRWAAPLDGRAGGTWLGISERGAVMALLNRSEGRRPAESESRGRLIPDLLPAADPERLVGSLAGRDLVRFAPFRLLALWHDREPGLVAGWDGHRLEIEEVDSRLGLLCSSGLGDDRATTARGAVWNEARRRHPFDLAAHRAFHRDHTPQPSAWSVCVHRDDARSVSLTEAELEAGRSRLVYHDAPPCETGERFEIELSAAGHPAPQPG